MKTTTMMQKTLTALAILTTLTACDRAVRTGLRSERGERQYRSAMDDYAAGRIADAIRGLENTISENPANGSARFQLACLYQDAKKDFVKAYCAFREFLMQCPDSDKAKLARDRLVACERDAACVLAGKHGLLQADAASKELELVRKELADAKKRVEALEKELQGERDRNQSLSNEKKRLVQVIKNEAGEEEPAETPALSASEVKDVKALLEEEDDDGDRIKISDEVAKLRKEKEDERIGAGSLLLPSRKSGDVEKRDAEKKTAEAPKEPVGPSHPETYVVEEGDTLIRIATRFYGTRHAWQKIKDANKAVISADGRVRAGDTIKLP